MGGRKGDWVRRGEERREDSLSNNERMKERRERKKESKGSKEERTMIPLRD
jgi:hypothetical protein